MISKHGLRGQVFAVAGQKSPHCRWGSPPAAGLEGVGFTVGEPGASGPPPATGGGDELVAGFWNTVEVEGEPVIHVLRTPPVLCTRHVPVYFEVVSDLLPTEVQAHVSRDEPGRP